MDLSDSSGKRKSIECTLNHKKESKPNYQFMKAKLTKNSNPVFYTKSAVYTNINTRIFVIKIDKNEGGESYTCRDEVGGGDGGREWRWRWPDGGSWRSLSLFSLLLSFFLLLSLFFLLLFSFPQNFKGTR